jgi:hypothetical protein
MTGKSIERRSGAAWKEKVVIADAPSNAFYGHPGASDLQRGAEKQEILDNTTAFAFPDVWRRIPDDEERNARGRTAA